MGFKILQNISGLYISLSLRQFKLLRSVITPVIYLSRLCDCIFFAFSKSVIKKECKFVDSESIFVKSCIRQLSIKILFSFKIDDIIHIIRTYKHFSKFLNFFYLKCIKILLFWYSSFISYIVAFCQKCHFINKIKFFIKI